MLRSLVGSEMFIRDRNGPISFFVWFHDFFSNILRDSLFGGLVNYLRDFLCDFMRLVQILSKKLSSLHFSLNRTKVKPNGWIIQRWLVATVRVLIITFTVFRMRREKSPPLLLHQLRQRDESFNAPCLPLLRDIDRVSLPFLPLLRKTERIPRWEIDLVSMFHFRRDHR